MDQHLQSTTAQSTTASIGIDDDGASTGTSIDINDSSTDSSSTDTRTTIARRSTITKKPQEDEDDDDRIVGGINVEDSISMEEDFSRYPVSCC